MSRQELDKQALDRFIQKRNLFSFLYSRKIYSKKREEKPITTCSWCKESIYEDEPIHQVYDEVICDHCRDASGHAASIL